MFGVAHDGSVLLEQNGRPGCVMTSHTTYQQSCTRYKFEKRPDIQCEGMEVYQLMGKSNEDKSSEMEKQLITDRKKGWV